MLDLHRMLSRPASAPMGAEARRARQRALRAAHRVSGLFREPGRLVPQAQCDLGQSRLAGPEAVAGFARRDARPMREGFAHGAWGMRQEIGRQGGPFRCQEHIGKTVETGLFGCSIDAAEQTNSLMRCKEPRRAMPVASIQEAVAGDFKTLFGEAPSTMQGLAQRLQHAFECGAGGAAVSTVADRNLVRFRSTYHRALRARGMGDEGEARGHSP